MITPYNAKCSLLRVGDLINKDIGEWRMNMLEKVFLVVDVDAIKHISLSCTWLIDRLVWHFSPNGELLVSSTYHLIQQCKGKDSSQSSMTNGQKR